MTDYKPSQDEFLATVRNHEMTVKHDDGLYRHLKFAKPGTGIESFAISTFPGYLVYTGDMGSYVFSRLPDMFNFFSGGEDINPRYWAEKVEAVDRYGSIEEFSQDVFAEQLNEAFAEWLEDHHEASEQRQDEIRRVVEYLIDSDFQSREEAVVALDDACEGASTNLMDASERRFSRYSYRYIWACRAIQWGVAKYKAFKESE